VASSSTTRMFMSAFYGIARSPTRGRTYPSVSGMQVGW
jgi:hypothetical protein